MSYPQQGNPQQGYPQQGYPQQGYPQQGQPGYYPQPGNVHIVQQPQFVVVGGDCPQCGTGYLRDDFGCVAIFLAIFFFPLGILCCLAMKERRCSNCRSVF